jgi:hypothetical protein
MEADNVSVEDDAGGCSRLEPRAYEEWPGSNL